MESTNLAGGPPAVTPDRLLSVHQAVAAVMRQMRAVSKDGTAPTAMGGFKYRRIEDVMNALHDAMAAEGLFIAPNVVGETYSESKTQAGKVETVVRVRIAFEVYGPRGDSIKCGPILAEGKDTQDKAANKAHSAAFKTFLLQLFMIPTQDLAQAPGLEDQERGRDYVTEPVTQPPNQANTRIERKPEPARAAQVDSRITNNDRNACASTAAPAGEPAANRQAWDDAQKRLASNAKPVPADTASPELAQRQAAAGNAILEYLADIQDEKARKEQAIRMLGVVLPGKTGTRQLDALDCERVKLAVVMLPRVAGGTVKDVNEYLDKNWVMSPLHKLSQLEIDSAYRKMAEAIEAGSPLDIPEDDVPF